MSDPQNATQDSIESTKEPSANTTTTVIMGSHESIPCSKEEAIDLLHEQQLSVASISERVNSKSEIVNKNVFIDSSFTHNDTTNNDDDSASESLPPTDEILEEPHDRSDGSDSGLGSEISEERQIDTIVVTAVESDNESSFLESIERESALDIQDHISIEVSSMSHTPSRSALKRRSSSPQNEGAPKCKKKQGITFDDVTVFYFPRTQGFTCVPSQGGSTLGMGSKHSYVRKFSIVEHANEQRRVHRQLLQRLRSERHNVRNTTSSSEDSESEEEMSDGSDSEMDLENYYFLQPVPTRQRRALLRSAGIRKIDSIEKDECRDIRTSREFCGCGCKGYCDPDTCTCSQAGIKCQVDRLNFPCGCSRDNCGNSSGRIEFNPVRVRTHFIHTIMRLELEKKQNEAELRDEKNEKGPDENWANSGRLTDYSSSERKFVGGLVKDLTLNSNVEVESCVHNGNFTNLHYGAPGEGPGMEAHSSQSFSNLPTREDSLDLYTFREDCYQEAINQETATERKLPHRPFTPTQAFHIPEGRFPETNFQAGAPTYAATSSQYTHAYPVTFGDFAPIFNTYGTMYNPEIGTKTFDNNFQQSNNYEEFPATESDNFSVSDSKDSQYTNLNPVGANNKLESFSDLLNGRYTYGSYDDSPGFDSISTSDLPPNNADKHISITASNTDDCEDNFGEIIKKSMVESVSA